MVIYSGNYISEMRFVQPLIIGDKISIFHNNIDNLIDSIKNELIDFLHYNENMHLSCVLFNEKCYVFDMWIDGQEDMLFKDRIGIINNMFKELENVIVVPTYEIDNGFLIEEYLKKFVSEGYDGIIIKGNSAHNEQDKYTWYCNG